MKTRTNLKNNSPEFAELYRYVSESFVKGSKRIGDAMEAIRASKELNIPTKTMLFKRFKSIYSSINYIVDVIGRRGKVK